MTNQEKLVHQARLALTNDAFVREAGNCEKLQREIVQAALGHGFDAYWKGTAHKTMKAFEGTKYYHKGLGYGEAGDLLYFAGTSNQTAGHVVMNVGGGLCIQNSVTDAWDKATGYKGTKLLKTMREPTCVVRLW